MYLDVWMQMNTNWECSLAGKYVRSTGNFPPRRSPGGKILPPKCPNVSPLSLGGDFMLKIEDAYRLALLSPGQLLQRDRVISGALCLLFVN